MGKAIILVEVTVKLDFQNGTTPILKTYSGSSSPGGSNVVQSDGSIDLTKVNKGSDDSQIAVISFVLDSVNNPTKTPCWFAGIAFTDSSRKPYSGSELTAAVTSNQIVILDLDLDGSTYGYCLTVYYGNISSPSTLALDPPLVNRTPPS